MIKQDQAIDRTQIKKKHLQIVISTHSMEFLQGLPNTAIKVFEDNGEGNFRAEGNDL